MSLIQIQFARTSAHDMPVPSRSTSGAAGYDLPLLADEPAMLWVGDQLSGRTGWSVAIPHGHVGLIWPRSGLALRSGLGVGAGVIDSDYRGEIRVLLQRVASRGCDPAPLRIQPGDRIGQLVIVPCVMAAGIEVEILPDTERGGGGFGSTGR